MQLQLEFPRSFQLWTYTVSHAQLLLRSNKTDQYRTRIDVLFKDVGRICLASKMDAVAIKRINNNEFKLYSSFSDEKELRRRNIYVLLSNESKINYIIAGSMSWNEDSGDYNDESVFQKSLGI